MPYTFKHGDRPLEGVTVQRAVGRGGFGEVYYALTDSGKQVALKYLRENPEIELRGIAHVMNLKSPYLITIYDVRRNATSEPFVIMEYVSGPSLRELMSAEPGGFSVQKAAFFLKGIAKGLSYLHERGIVHRDLKPANIFYDDGYVKIGDYGLSKHISVSQHSGQTVSVGTVHYMAPEIGSGSYTKAIDIYALGVILYEMLTGRLPFTGSSMAEILMRHVRENADMSGVPAPFGPIIAKALAKDPNDRYQDADEMLAAVMEHGDITADIESFDTSSLSRVPRSAEASDNAATMTSPPRPPPVPPLDVREVPVAALPKEMQRKLDRLSRKLEDKAARLERKFGVRLGGPVRAAPAGAVPAVHRRAQVFVLLVVCFAIALVLGLLAGGQGQVESRVAAIAFFIVGGTVGPLFAHFKVLSRWWTHSAFFDRLAYASVGGLCMLPAFGIANDEVSANLARIILCPIAAMLVCDWSQRIEKGRSGQVNGGSAIWPAIIGLIVAGMVSADDYRWTAAGVTAAIALLTQAAAGLWPYAATRVPPLPGSAAPLGPSPATAAAAAYVDRPQPVAQPGIDRSVPTPPPESLTPLAALPREAGLPRSMFARAIFGLLAVAAVTVCLGSFFSLVIVRPADQEICFGLLWATLGGVAALPFLISKARQSHKLPWWRGTFRMFFVSAGLIFTSAMIAVLAFQPLNDEGEMTATIFGLVAGVVVSLTALLLCGRPRRGAAPPVAPPSASPEVVGPAMQPSFVGRTANAGLAFIGKLMLMVGLVLAAARGPLLEEAIQRGVVKADKQTLEVLRTGLPPVTALAPLALGGLLLVMARRREGAGHFFRGCVGCGLLIWCGLVTLLWAGKPLKILLTQGDVPELHESDMWGPLMMTALSLAIGLLVLLWPKRELSGNRPIIV